MAEIYVFGTHALKLYRSPDAKAQAFGEAATLAIVGSHGLSVPTVHEVGLYNGRWGLVMDLAPGAPLADAARDEAESVMAEMLQLHQQLHAVSETRLRPLKPRLAANISRAPGLDGEMRGRLMSRLSALPDGDRICHGDFHPLNVVGAPGNAMVIDWPDATSGAPAADVCRTYLLLLPRVGAHAAAYVSRYSQASGLAEAEIMAWLPVVAAARLSEDIADETENLLNLAHT